MNTYAVTGTFHGSIIYAASEGDARRMFHQYYSGESIILLKLLNKRNMWKLTQSKEPKGLQDLKVKIMLKEMCQYSYATYSEEFENHFKQLIKEISSSNSFSADLIYKVVKVDLKNIEIWKCNIKGDLKEKMFSIEFLN